MGVGALADKKMESDRVDQQEPRPTIKPFKEQSAISCLQRIVGLGNITCQDFWSQYWQKSVVVFPSDSNGNRKTTDTAYDELIDNGWSVMLDLMERSMQREAELIQQGRDDDDKARVEDSVGQDDELLQQARALFFQQQASLSLEERAQRYNNSVFAAYLDGCSLVHNHADCLSPSLARLCQDLQQPQRGETSGSIPTCVPHVYCNTYLTPPDSQAAPEHADDRDVFVIQVCGSKEWTIYETIPVPFPYPDEQVGKGSVAVPQSVLKGPVLLKKTLQPGDVLYMPRGYVHCAHSLPDALSFHVTVAVATHDWTIANLVTQHTERILKSVVDYRKAVLPVASPSGNASEIGLQKELDDAFQKLQKEITADAIQKSLQHRIQVHNERATKARDLLFSKTGEQQPRVGTKRPLSEISTTESPGLSRIVGPRAAQAVTLYSFVRVATDDEKQFARKAVVSNHPQYCPGLQLRECIADNILDILQRIRSSSGDKFRVGTLRDLLSSQASHSHYLCDLALVCFAKQCVGLGALAVEKGHDSTD